MTNTEAKVLRSVITYNGKQPLFFQTLKREYFGDEARIVYDFIWELYKDAKNFELEYVLESINNDSISSQLLEQIPTENVEQYYEIIVTEYNIYRRVMLKDELIKLQGEREVDLEALFAKYRPAVSTKFLTLRQRLQFIKDNNITFEKYQTGVNFLDIILHGGIETHQLVLVSGDYEAGKTTLCLQILRNLSKSYKSVYFCFEFPVNKYALSEEALLQKMQKEQILTFKDIDNIYDNSIPVDEGMTLEIVAATILFMASHGVKFFVIDSQMRLINTEQEATNNSEAVEARKFAILNNLCNKYGVVVFLIVQTSKGDNKSPLGSKRGAYEASIMMRVEHNPSKDKSLPFDPDSRTIVIQKNKQTGKHASFNVAFNRELRTFHCEDLVEYENYDREAEMAERMANRGFKIDGVEQDIDLSGF